MSDLERKRMEKDKESIHDFYHNLFVLVHFLTTHLTMTAVHIRRVDREPFVPVWASTVSTLWKTTGHFWPPLEVAESWHTQNN